MMQRITKCIKRNDDSDDDDDDDNINNNISRMMDYG